MLAPPRSPVADLYLATESVVGQERARQQMAVLIARQIDVQRGTFDRSQAAIVAGRTGSGKTYLARMMCEASGLPFAEVNATQYTESGYAGEDLSQMFLSLLESAARMIDEEHARYAGLPVLAKAEQQDSVLKRDDLDRVVERAQAGVILLDEMDKWMHRMNHTTGRLDTAIQAELLKMIEGSVEYVSDEEDEIGTPFDTGKVLIICAGAFVGLIGKVLRRLERDDEFMHDEGFYALIEQSDFVRYGMIPELAGRLGVHIFLRPLRKEHLTEILMQPGGAVEEYRQRFEALGVEWQVPDAVIGRIAERALVKDVGARGVDNVLWICFSDALFHAHLADGPAAVTMGVNDPRARLVTS